MKNYTIRRYCIETYVVQAENEEAALDAFNNNIAEHTDTETTELAISEDEEE